MKRRRRLRRLVPDPALFRRRAAGETLRQLAADYSVSHTTLGRFLPGRRLAASCARPGGCCGPSARQTPPPLEPTAAAAAGAPHGRRAGSGRASQARHHRAVAARIAGRQASDGGRTPRVRIKATIRRWSSW